MDTAPRHRRRGLIQNIAIALLSVSAVLLFTQLQLYNLDTPEDPHYLERLMGTLPSGSPTELREFPVPVRVVLTDSYGRYGSLGLTTNSDGFSALGLREALGSVQALTVSNTDGFRAALSGVSIYFDFLDPLPVPVVAGLIGVESSDLTGTVRGCCSPPEPGIPSACTCGTARTAWCGARCLMPRSPPVRWRRP